MSTINIKQEAIDREIRHDRMAKSLAKIRNSHPDEDEEEDVEVDAEEEKEEEEEGEEETTEEEETPAAAAAASSSSASAEKKKPTKKRLYGVDAFNSRSAKAGYHVEHPSDSKGLLRRGNQIFDDRLNSLAKQLGISPAYLASFIREYIATDERYNGRPFRMSQSALEFIVHRLATFLDQEVDAARYATNHSGRRTMMDTDVIVSNHIRAVGKAKTIDELNGRMDPFGPLLSEEAAVSKKRKAINTARREEAKRQKVAADAEADE
jgi:histone H3/H4